MNTGRKEREKVESGREKRQRDKESGQQKHLGDSRGGSKKGNCKAVLNSDKVRPSPSFLQHQKFPAVELISGI